MPARGDPAFCGHSASVPVRSPAPGSVQPGMDGETAPAHLSRSADVHDRDGRFEQAAVLTRICRRAFATAYAADDALMHANKPTSVSA
jgi:hypothetical protein